jgi:hypothetical protein
MPLAASNGSWFVAPLTLERTGTFTQSLNTGIPELLSKSRGIPSTCSTGLYDMTLYHAQSDNGWIPDPYNNGLVCSQRIAGAAVVAEAGCPSAARWYWVTLQFRSQHCDTRRAWVDWDPATEHFPTPQPRSTRSRSPAPIKSVVTLPP